MENQTAEICFRVLRAVIEKRAIEMVRPYSVTDYADFIKMMGNMDKNEFDVLASLFLDQDNLNAATDNNQKEFISLASAKGKLPLMGDDEDKALINTYLFLAAYRVKVGKKYEDLPDYLEDHENLNIEVFDKYIKLLTSDRNTFMKEKANVPPNKIITKVSDDTFRAAFNRQVRNMASKKNLLDIAINSCIAVVVVEEKEAPKKTGTGKKASGAPAYEYKYTEKEDRIPGVVYDDGGFPVLNSDGTAAEEITDEEIPYEGKETVTRTNLVDSLNAHFRKVRVLL